MKNNVQIRGMDLGMRRSLYLRSWRRGLLMFALLGLFIEFRGVPHLRLTDPARARAGLEYWSVTGLREVRAKQTAPLIVLVPLERSLLSHASDAASTVLDTIKQL